MEQQAKRRWGILVAVIFTAIGYLIHEGAPDFLDGMGIPFKTYAHEAGKQVRSAIRQIDGEAKVELEKCEATIRATFASAKADYRKVNTSWKDCISVLLLGRGEGLGCQQRAPKRRSRLPVRSPHRTGRRSLLCRPLKLDV